jgi:hypothetical protein
MDFTLDGFGSGVDGNLNAVSLGASGVSSFRIMPNISSYRGGDTAQMKVCIQSITGQ